MRNSCRIGDIAIGDGGPLAIIAGPCVLEDQATNESIGRALKDACEEAGLPLIFKASFDKANRTSVSSFRGPGIAEGLSELRRIRALLGVPVVTDIHEPAQAEIAAEVVDLLQVPAFLCRQTDLLKACAKTGKPVNVKKGQFLAPSDMTHVMEKLHESGATEILLTERGTFFGYHRLVNDFIGFGDLKELGPPVCFDVTHSTQLPGGGTGMTAGRPDRASLLARCAVVAGTDALFLECHPDPPSARSDGSTVQTPQAAAEIIRQAARLRSALDAER